MYNATVVSRKDFTPELFCIGITPDAPHKPFQPGQYVAIGLLGSSPRPEHYPPERESSAPDKIIKRAYSIASSPNEGTIIELYIAIVPDGALTSRLALTQPGDRIYMAPKITGTFTLDGVSESSSLVLVSTGTGLAPFISMVRTPSTWTPGRTITLLHGVRYVPDLGYREELTALEREKEGSFRYLPMVSRSQDNEWSGHKGHVQSLFEKGVVSLSPQRDHVFLCGNPAMIDAVEHLLVPQGFTEHTKKTPGNLHLERYW